MYVFTFHVITYNVDQKFDVFKYILNTYCSTLSGGRELHIEPGNTLRPAFYHHQQKKARKEET